MEPILDPDGVCLLLDSQDMGLAELERGLAMGVDEKDLVYSLAAQVHHLSSDEDKKKTLQRIEEDFPDLYPLVKKRVWQLAAPESMPPRPQQDSSGDGGDSKFTRFIHNFDLAAATLRKNGVWATIVVLLFTVGYLGLQLQESRKRQEDLLEEMIRMRGRHASRSIAVDRGDAPSASAQ